MLDLEIFGPSHSRYVPLKAELPLPSSNCKGEACLSRSHFKGGTLEQGSTESSASVLPRNGDFSSASASVRRTIPRFASASVKNRFEIPRPRRNWTILPRI